MAGIRVRPLRNGDTSYDVRWCEDGTRFFRTFSSLTDAETFAEQHPDPRRGRVLPVADRIKQSIRIDENGCWVWQLHCMPTEGYGLIAVDGRPRLAHRVSYETFVGPIPDGLQLDHLCRNRPCVNPDHLEPVTCQENIRRSPIHISRVRASKTHCPQNHEYTDENTYVDRRGRRSCRTCTRIRNRLADQRRRAVA